MQANITQDRIMHSAMQPFLRLGQANMDVLTRFSTSLHAASPTASNAPNFLSPGLASSVNLAWLNGFAELMQGMVRNYTEFMVELAGSGMAAMVQNQAALKHQAQEDAQNVIDAAEVRDTAEARGRKMHPAA